jgi:hypothetical protein
MCVDPHTLYPLNHKFVQSSQKSLMKLAARFASVNRMIDILMLCVNWGTRSTRICRPRLSDGPGIRHSELKPGTYLRQLRLNAKPAE